MESHTKQQIPETVSEMELRAKRSKSAGLSSRTWERDLWGFFLEVGDNVRWRDKWGGPRGDHNPQGRPGGAGAHRWVVDPTCPPHLSLHTTSSLTSTKKFSIALSPVFLLSNPRISISLLEPSFPKLFRGIVAQYVTPPFVQLVFASLVFILNN